MTLKLLSYISNGNIQTGVVTERGVIPLATIAEAIGIKLEDNMLSLIDENVFKKLKEAMSHNETQFSPSDYLNYETIQFAAPISKPEKIICVGLNYLDHVSEGPNLDIPKEPVLFNKFNNALAANGEEIPLPSDGKHVDYEGELVIIICKEASNITEEDALDYVFGYTVGNDLSVRDLQFRSSQWLLGKSLDKFAPMGPIVVTADSIDPNSLNITTKRNGEVVQNSNTNKMIFNCAKIISYISKYMTLVPGDIIFTGTPEGVILGYDEPAQKWLDSGDVIDITIDQIGTLSNRIG